MIIGLTACVGIETPTSLEESQVTQINNPTSTIISTKTRRPTITSTPFPTSLPTSTGNLASTQSCMTNEQDSKLFILHNDVLFYSLVDEEILDKALLNNYLEWSSFRQKLDWRDEPVSAGIIIDDASFAETFQLNPAVTLVTVGLHLDWELPPDNDLFTISRSTGEKLDDQTKIKTKYPEVGNAATYSIYAFFEYDQAILEDWCKTYVKLFDESPLYLPNYDTD
jgi:hypothetical protein